MKTFLIQALNRYYTTPPQYIKVIAKSEYNAIGSFHNENKDLIVNKIKQIKSK